MAEKHSEKIQGDESKPQSAETAQPSKKALPPEEASTPEQTPSSEEAIKGAIQKTKETFESLPSIPSPRGVVEGGLSSARESLVGSLSMTQELEHLGSDYADFYKKAITVPPKALLDLVSLHPIDAVTQAVDGAKKICDDLIHFRLLEAAKTSIIAPVKTLTTLVDLHPINAAQGLASGAKDIMGDMAHIATSPVRLAAAGAVGAASALKTVATLPFAAAEFVAKSPFKLWNTVSEGLEEIFKMADRADKWADRKANEIMKG